MKRNQAFWLQTVCVAVVLAFALAGCGEQAGAPDKGGASAKPGVPGEGVASDAAASDAAAADAHKPVVALVMKSLANEFFLTMEQGAVAHHKAHADEYELVAQGIKDELDVNRQVQLVEQMVARGVDALVIAPADSKALVAVCKRAMEKGIIVVNIDNKFDDEVLADKQVRIPFVGPDNRAGARMVGEYLAQRLAPGDPVAIIEGVPSAFNAIQRKQGFEDAMNAAGMRIIDSQSGDWEMSKANTVASAMITEHPELKAFLCANDSMALGAAAALKDAGRAGDVLVVGYDNISAVQELMGEGRILATADQHADRLAVFGIEYALEMLAQGTVPEDRQTPVDLVKAPE
ncbi:MAG: sugar ABC transporter substrate-binding protein [Phycisphaerae bacterium]|nr:sugar ABC transporter substrate-binding protein [Phycisphaerae bacterium]